MSQRNILEMRVRESQCKAPAHPRVHLPSVQDLLTRSNDAISSQENSPPGIRDTMAQWCVTVSPADSLYDCLRRMDESEVHYLRVSDGDQSVGLISREQVLAALVVYLERVFHEYELDQQIVFLQGTYSC